MLADAARRLEHLNWQGVAMLEYRWDPASDRLYLMEMNARFWGSLHLALYAGVDFPRLLLDASHGHEERCDAFTEGVYARLTFPSEVEFVYSLLKDPNVGVRAKLAAVVEFFRLFFDRKVRADLDYPGDRLLYWKMIPRSIRKFLS